LKYGQGKFLNNMAGWLRLYLNKRNIMTTLNDKKTAVLDESTLTSLGGTSGLASPLVKRVITLYRQEATKLVHGILLRSAHTLKSSSASIGAYALAQVAKQIEHFAQQASITEAKALLAQLLSEFTRLMDELNFFEQKLTPINDLA
jgi:HPt (histidine-containing phosphotransfer) domain-containing protein